MGLPAERLCLLSHVLFGDEAGTVFAGEVVGGPLGHDHDLVVKLDQEKDVDEQPHNPGGEAGELSPGHVYHGGVAANDRQIAAVSVFELG